MPWITEEQKKLAKEVDLLTYLQASEPWEVKKTGPGEFRTVSHGSLVISKGLWVWNRGQLGGRSALDYLMKVRGMGFVEAAEMILGNPAILSGNIRPTDWQNQAVQPNQKLTAAAYEQTSMPSEPKAQKKLLLPQKAAVPHKAVKYLGQRGIHPDIIGQCLKAGILYEGIYRNPREPAINGTAVCVFVGTDETGSARFAAMRGIGKDLKRDAPGSDKSFGFILSSEDPCSKSLAVFEAPIDLLSHATLTRLGHSGFAGHRLSLGGTSDVALMAYLERNPKTDYISLCLDSDKGGSEAAGTIYSNLAGDRRYGHIEITIDLPLEAGDYNELLLHTIKHEKGIKAAGLTSKGGFSM